MGNRPCGFRSILHEPWWRAPEEMAEVGNNSTASRDDDAAKTTTAYVTEKVDVYALGSVLFHVLTTHSPRGKMKKWLADAARERVRLGAPPEMREPYSSGGKDGKLKRDPIVRAFLKAMDLCFEKDPRRRGTAIRVARVL